MLIAGSMLKLDIYNTNISHNITFKKFVIILITGVPAVKLKIPKINSKHNFSNRHGDSHFFQSESPLERCVWRYQNVRTKSSEGAQVAAGCQNKWPGVFS
jgi:hypothetical protein